MVDAQLDRGDRVFGCCAMIIAGFVGLNGIAVYESQREDELQKKKRYLERIKTYADFDKNEVLAASEMVDVYRRAGISNPKPLDEFTPEEAKRVANDYFMDERKEETEKENESKMKAYLLVHEFRRIEEESREYQIQMREGERRMQEHERLRLMERFGNKRP